MSLLQHLLESIKVFALDPDEQIRSLPQFVCVPDELALLFCDQFEVVRAHITVDWGIDVSTLCNKIYSLFETMSETEKQRFFAPQALFLVPQWNEIRGYAKQILQLLQVSGQPPDLNWVTFVKHQHRE